MKKLCLLLLACLALGAGCRKKVARQWDYPNVDVCIYVENSAGEDMLSATSRPTLFGVKGSMRVTYNGETSACVFPARPGTRASEPKLPVFAGLTYRLYEPGLKYLTFGEFSIDTRDYRGEKFTVDWGDGTRTDFEFDLWHTDNGDDEPTVHQSIRATGGAGAGTSSDKSLVITIVK